jgi:hypothetical protein
MDRPDRITRAIRAEVSEAVLRSFRAGCIDLGSWRDDHQREYLARIPQIKARWEAMRK